MHRRLIAALALILFGCLGQSSAAQEPVLPSQVYLPLLSARLPADLKISALYYDGFVSGEGDEAFQLYNPHDFDVNLDGWRVTNGNHSAIFSGGLTLAPKGVLWCAREATAFQQSFGALPDCEYGSDTDPTVPDLASSKLQFANTGGRLTLSTGGRTSDVLVYKTGDTSGYGWSGASVTPYKPTSSFHEQGQILYRKLDERSGLPLWDTGTAADWSQDPDDIWQGRRVRYPGWSLDRFPLPASGDAEATLQVFVAPDHAFETLAAHLRFATQRIQFEGYTLESVPLGDVLAERAQAGVQVMVLLEGAPPGGVTDQQRWIVQRLVEAGAQVYYMRSGADANIHDRYLYQHAKLWLLDDRLALIGTENPSPDSFPNDEKADGTTGRRGVYLVTDAPLVVERVRKIMSTDTDVAHRDVWRYSAADPTLGAPPPDFTPALTSGGTGYTVSIPAPLTLQGRFHFEVCQSPEHALRRSDCLPGLTGRAGAGDTLLIEQLSEPTYWGPSDASVDSDPNPRLLAYIEAARRGARVRLLLDAHFDDLSSPRSNLRTEEYLRSVTRREGLDLEVRRGNPTGMGLHNKMVLAEIDGQGWVMAGSLNGGEVSAKLNREVALIVASTAAHDYLAKMFWQDWGG